MIDYKAEGVQSKFPLKRPTVSAEAWKVEEGLPYLLALRSFEKNLGEGLPCCLRGGRDGTRRVGSFWAIDNLILDVLCSALRKLFVVSPNLMLSAS